MPVVLSEAIVQVVLSILTDMLSLLIPSNPEPEKVTAVPPADVPLEGLIKLIKYEFASVYLTVPFESVSGDTVIEQVASASSVF